MPSFPARRARAAGLVPIPLVAGCAVIAVQFATLGHAAGRRSHPSPSFAATSHRVPIGPRASTFTTPAPTVPPTTTTTSTTAPPPPVPAPAPPLPVTNVPPPPAPTQEGLAAASAAVPAKGQATVWGCTAALAYLAAYANPSFTFECPGNALGREGMTCADEPGVCPNEDIIAIADPCPAAYMNEASNSWVLTGLSTAVIDPYGSC